MPESARLGCSFEPADAVCDDGSFAESDWFFGWLLNVEIRLSWRRNCSNFRAGFEVSLVPAACFGISGSANLADAPNVVSEAVLSETRPAFNLPDNVTAVETPTMRTAVAATKKRDLR